MAGRLFVLDSSGGRIVSLNADGSYPTVIAADCRRPDSIAIDAEAGHIYWTNMGVPIWNDGSIERADFDGGNRKTIIPTGGTFTPRQIHIDKNGGKLYWADREGMSVMRSNLDGSHIETLVYDGQGDGDRRDMSRWCVGIAVDATRGHLYWSQTGADDGAQGRIFRANIEIPEGQTADNRADIEMLVDDLPEPIDLKLDLNGGMIYWTRRSGRPHGNTVNRAPMDRSSEPEILVTHLMEDICLDLDLDGNRMFLTDLSGSIHTASLDGSNKRALLYVTGALAGVAYANLPARTA